MENAEVPMETGDVQEAGTPTRNFSLNGPTAHVVVQSTPQFSAGAAREDSTDEETTEGALEDSAQSKPQRPSKTGCGICGTNNLKAPRAREGHVASHGRPDEFVCSLCGVRKPKYSLRNAHERNVHRLERHEVDQGRKEAIQISSEDLQLFRQVGTNIAAVQAAAVESHAPAGESFSVCQKRAARTSAPSARPKRRRRSPSTSSSEDEWPEETTDGENDEAESAEEQESAEEAEDVDGTEDVEPPAPAAHELQPAVELPAAAHLPPVQPSVQVPPSPSARSISTAASAQPTAHAEVNGLVKHSGAHAFTGQNGELKADVHVLESTVASLRAERDEWRTKAAEAERARETAVEECAQLKEKADKLVADLEAEKSHSSSLIAKLQGHNVEQQKEWAAAAAKWDRKKSKLKQQITELQSNVAVQQSEGEALRECAQQTAEARDAAVQEGVRLQHENAELKQQLEATAAQPLTRAPEQQQQEQEAAGAGAAAQQPANEQLAAVFWAMLQEGHLIDFKLVAEGKEIAAHKTLLSLKSAFFDAFFRDRPQASEFVVDAGFSARVIHRMLAFCYCGQLSELETDARELYVAARRFGVADLQAECTRVLKAGISANTSADNVADLLVLAARHDDRELSQFVLEFAERGGCKTRLFLSKPVQWIVHNEVEIYDKIVALME